MQNENEIRLGKEENGSVTHGPLSYIYIYTHTHTHTHTYIHTYTRVCAEVGLYFIHITRYGGVEVQLHAF